MSSTKQFIAGFRRFRERHFAAGGVQFQELMRFGQAPKTLVVACCDSRVGPALVLDCAPGVLFVIRNVANLGFRPLSARATITAPVRRWSSVCAIWGCHHRARACAVRRHPRAA